MLRSTLLWYFDFSLWRRFVQSLELSHGRLPNIWLTGRHSDPIGMIHTQAYGLLKKAASVHAGDRFLIGGFHAISGDTKKWWNEQILVDKKNELMSDLLFTVHQHGSDDVTWKPPIVPTHPNLLEVSLPLPTFLLLCVPNQNRHAIDHFVSKITWIIERQSYKNTLLLACASCVMVTPLQDYRFLNKGWIKVRAVWIWTIQRKFISHFSVGSKAAHDIICQKRVRVFHQGFQTRQTPRNRWKHEAAGRVLLLFWGVLNPWWNTKHEFLTWLLKLVQEFSEIISVE